MAWICCLFGRDGEAVTSFSLLCGGGTLPLTKPVGIWASTSDGGIRAGPVSSVGIWASTSDGGIRAGPVSSVGIWAGPVSGVGIWAGPVSGVGIWADPVSGVGIWAGPASGVGIWADPVSGVVSEHGVVTWAGTSKSGVVTRGRLGVAMCA